MKKVPVPDLGHASSSSNGTFVISSGSEWMNGARVADEEKRNYQDKLERAKSNDVFKYVFLINNASVEKYVQQSRQQAETVFRVGQRIAIAGFSLLLASVIIGLASMYTDRSLVMAYFAGVVGVLTDLVAVALFWMYKKTLQQIDGFYQRMMTRQHASLMSMDQISSRSDITLDPPRVSDDAQGSNSHRSRSRS